MSNKFALLDRDGAIILDKVCPSDPAGLEFAPDALEGMRLLLDADFTLALATNQSGIARGHFDEAALARIHARLAEMPADEGLSLAGVTCCSHGPADGCDCRKPAPGMAEAAMCDLGVSPAQALVIGDSDADMGLAQAAGLKGVRIGAGEGGAKNFLEAARRARALFG